MTPRLTTLRPRVEMASQCNAPRPKVDDPRRAAAEAVYDAILKAQRDAGDAALVEALDKLTSATGQNRFRHAASVLRGTKLGRHAIIDREASRRVAEFPAACRREAVGFLAGQLAGPGAYGGMGV